MTGFPRYEPLAHWDYSQRTQCYLRSKPSSRASLTGEQPDPWDLLQPQDETSRHRGANPRRRYGLLGGMSLLSPGYLLAVGLGAPTCRRGITRPFFRTCSTRESRSQAPLCPCTRRLIADQTEGTFGRLRYRFGGDRPSQTAHQTLSPPRIHSQGLEPQCNKGGISTLAP